MVWNTIGFTSGEGSLRINQHGQRRKIRRSLQFGVGVDLGTAPPITSAPTAHRPAPQTPPQQTTAPVVVANPPTSPPTTAAVVPEAPGPSLPGGNLSDSMTFSYAFQLWVPSEMMLDHSIDLVSDSFTDVVNNLILGDYPTLALLNLTSVNSGKQAKDETHKQNQMHVKQISFNKSCIRALR